MRQTVHCTDIHVRQKNVGKKALGLKISSPLWGNKMEELRNWWVADGDGEVRKEHSRREDHQERAFQNTPQNKQKERTWLFPNSKGRHNLPEDTMTSTYLRNSLWILKSCQSPRRADSSQLTFTSPCYREEPESQRGRGRKQLSESPLAN